MPETVERVVTGEWTYTEFVLALGVKPMGIADVEGFTTWVNVPEGYALDEKTVDLGYRGEPNSSFSLS